jgi:hypothetical protein
LPLIDDCDAQVGFNDRSYMGTFSVAPLSFEKIILLSKILEDSIIIYLHKYSGIIMVDFYEERWSRESIQFSIVVQGPSLEQLLAPCFADIIPFSRRSK